MIDTALNAAIQAKIDAFEAYVVNHAKLDRAMKRVALHLSNPASVEMVMLYGPAGIGKSLIMGRIAKMLNDKRSLRPNDPDYRPVVHLIAMASGFRRFDFKTFYFDGLKALGDPMFNRLEKIDRVYLRSLRLDTTARLRIRLQEEMALRHTGYVLIDEAQHIAYGGKGGATVDQLDVLKSFSQMTNTVSLLAGPTKMDAEFAESPQLGRRSVSVAFDRYRADDPKELQQFADVANAFLTRMALLERPATNDVLTLLYDGSAGCVGILKDWLTRSYALAMHEAGDPEAAILTVDNLREMRLSVDKMESVMNDIRRLDVAAKRNASDEAYAEAVRGVSSGTSEPSASREKTPPKRAGRVGVRAPTRDPIVAPGM